MKKLFALATIAVALFVGKAGAQITVNAGYLNQTVNSSYTIGSTTVTNDPISINGAFVGSRINREIKGNLGISAGVNIEFYTKGDTLAGGVGGLIGGSVRNRHSELSLEVPVFLNYRLPVGKMNLKVYAGPVLGMGLYNKTVTTTTVTVLGNTTTDETTTDFLSNGLGDDDLGRTNVAVAAGVGLDFSTMGINVGYSYGLTDMYPNSNSLKGSYTRLFVGMNFNIK